MAIYATAKHWTQLQNDERFEALVSELENLLHSYGFCRLVAALALMTRREATKWFEGNHLENHDIYMGLYARLRSLYDSRAIPASWPRPKFHWF